MKSHPASIEFRTSRAKALPIVIFMPVFICLFGFGTYAFAYTAIMEGPTEQDWLGLLLGLPFLLFVWAEIRLLRRVVRPDVLTLTRAGWTLTRFGRASTFSWADYGEPAKRWVSSGKSGSDKICLEPRYGGKPVYIPGADFAHPFATIEESVRQARAGVLVEPAPVPAPRLYAFFVVPVSALSTGLLFGVVIFEAWRIGHL
jgi:hypothetical protein